MDEKNLKVHCDEDDEKVGKHYQKTYYYTKKIVPLQKSYRKNVKPRSHCRIKQNPWKKSNTLTLVTGQTKNPNSNLLKIPASLA